jgi:hypothetical protein
MNPIQAAIAAGQRAARQLGGVKIIFRRDTDDVPLVATIGRSNWQLENSAGGLMVLESRDFLVDVECLKLRGELIVPQRHDVILEDDLVYAVLDDSNIPAWRYSDQFRQQIRIHTKLVDKLT